jgi:two-component system cell cycle response regulator DivK
VPTWLAVEDEQDLNTLLLGLFEIWGINGIYFEDGGQVLHWLDDVDRGRYKGELPQLAILDIRLPHASGIDIAMRLRTSDRLSEIPIVLITAYALSPSEEYEIIQRTRADKLIYKPLPEMEILRAMLGNIIGTHSEAKSSEGR